MPGEDTGSPGCPSLRSEHAVVPGPRARAGWSFSPGGDVSAGSEPATSLGGACLLLGPTWKLLLLVAGKKKGLLGPRHECGPNRAH